jgi:hypothetical protein
VTIIETTKGYQFGGFTPVAWESTARYVEDISGKSFLFTVKSPRGNEGRKFALQISTSAILGNGSYGPIFGNGHDLLVADECNANANSFTNLGTGYRNDTGIDGTQVFTGERLFTVKEIEVFSIDPLNPHFSTSPKKCSSFLSSTKLCPIRHTTTEFE